MASSKILAARAHPLSFINILINDNICGTAPSGNALPGLNPRYLDSEDMSLAEPVATDIG
jgi:hypothetical protein